MCPLLSKWGAWAPRLGPPATPLPTPLNRKSNMRSPFVPKSTTLVDPELTLNGHYAIQGHYTCFSEPTTKIWMKIDPYYQRQKCSPGILVSSKISFMRIFTRVRWRGGVKWEWGGRKWRFSLSFAHIYHPKMPQLLYYNINVRLAKNSQLLVPYKYTDHDECTD